MGSPRTGPLGSLERQRRRRAPARAVPRSCCPSAPWSASLCADTENPVEGESVFQGSELPCDQLTSRCWEVAAGLCAWALALVCGGVGSP